MTFFQRNRLKTVFKHVLRYCVTLRLPALLRVFLLRIRFLIFWIATSGALGFYHPVNRIYSEMIPSLIASKITPHIEQLIHSYARHANLTIQHAFNVSSKWDSRADSTSGTLNNKRSFCESGFFMIRNSFNEFYSKTRSLRESFRLWMWVGYRMGFCTGVRNPYEMPRFVPYFFYVFRTHCKT